MMSCNWPLCGCAQSAPAPSFGGPPLRIWYYWGKYPNGYAGQRWWYLDLYWEDSEPNIGDQDYNAERTHPNMRVLIRALYDHRERRYIRTHYLYW